MWYKRKKMTWPGPRGRMGVIGESPGKPRGIRTSRKHIINFGCDFSPQGHSLSRPGTRGRKADLDSPREYYVNLAVLCTPSRDLQGTVRDSGETREEIVNISLSRSCFRPQGQSPLPAGAPWPEAGPDPPRGDGREHFGNASRPAGGGREGFPGKWSKSAINSGRKRIFLLSFVAWNPSSNTSCGYPPYSRTP